MQGAREISWEVVMVVHILWALRLFSSPHNLAYFTDQDEVQFDHELCNENKLNFLKNDVGKLE